MRRPFALALAAAIAIAGSAAFTGCESTVASDHHKKKKSGLPMAVKLRKQSMGGF